MRVHFNCSLISSNVCPEDEENYDLSVRHRDTFCWERESTPPRSSTVLVDPKCRFSETLILLICVLQLLNLQPQSCVSWQ